MSLRSFAFASTLLAAAVLPPANAASAENTQTPKTSDGIAAHGRDFDFLRGHWYVQNHRLLRQLQGSNEWTRSTGTLIGVTLLEGMGNYDELRSDESGAQGVSVRFYNGATRQWADYWVAHRDGVVQPPVFGTFRDGVGTFEGDDTLEGRTIRVRQLWTRLDTAAPRWEQAYSDDGGKTWETNWVMDFSRTPVR
jgi:hypothetical protein